MTWLRFEDNMLDHQKWRRAIRKGGDGVLAVWVRLLSWCSRNLTDGVIPADMVEEVAETRGDRSRRRALEALVESTLLARDAHGQCTIVDYLQRNPSRSEVLAARDAARGRKEKHRLKSSGTPESQRGTPSLERDAATTQSPSHPNPLPIPSQERDPERAPDPPSVPGLRRVEPTGGVVRVFSLPSKEPPQAYLDEALMAGVSPEQARSTWEHYFGAGLPERGVERPHQWLTKRAKERGNQVARAPGARGPNDALSLQAERVRMLEERERLTQ